MASNFGPDPVQDHKRRSVAACLTGKLAGPGVVAGIRPLDAQDKLAAVEAHIVFAQIFIADQDGLTDMAVAAWKIEPIAGERRAVIDARHDLPFARIADRAENEIVDRLAAA